MVSNYRHDKNTDISASSYLVDVPDHIVPLGGKKEQLSQNSNELWEYVYAVREKAVAFKNDNQPNLADVLDKISIDMTQLAIRFDEGKFSFEQSYEEIVSLYVFTEFYFDLSK